jgi:PAS domain S-box-containing protein
MPLSARNTGPDPGSVLAWQIFAPIAALFVILLLVAGFVGSEFFRPLAIERDLARAQRYADFAAVTVTRAAPSVTREEVIEEFRAAGLETLEFVHPLNAPSWASPRFIPSGPFVEAWASVNSAGGASVGSLTLRRQADSVVFVQRALRAFAIASCVTFALLVLLAWLLLRNRVTDRASAMIRELGAPTNADSNGSDAIDEVRAAWLASKSEADNENHSLRRLLDRHTEMFCASSKDGTIIDANEAYCRFFGKKRKELVGTNYLDLVPPADRGMALGSVQKLTPQSPSNTTEHRVVLPGGETRWVRWHDAALFEKGAEAAEIISFGTDITAEKRLADRIEALGLAFDQMQSLAETGSLTWDFAADRMEWTPETRRLLGVHEPAPASIEGVLAVIAPDDRETMRRLFGEAKEQGRNFQHEFRAILPDGSLRILQSRAEVLADPKTKLLNHLTCTLRDITALRDAEAATKRELRFREAIEQSMGVGIVVSDDKGRNLLVNPAFCEMTGWSEKELAGITAPYPYWPAEEISAINKAFELAIAGKTPPAGFELKFCRENGERFDVLVKVAPLLDSEDRQLGWLGAVTDISTLQTARRELVASNERLRIAQDVIEFGIWDWDPVADTLFWDRASFAMFGHPDAADPRAVWNVIHSEEEQERLTYELKRLIAAGGKSGQDRLRARWSDGSVHEILSTYVIIRDAQGQAVRVLGVNRDVTVETEEEQELLSAQERLAAAIEGGSFGTFEHVFGVGALNWNMANYEIHGIDPCITDPDELFHAWKAVVGPEYTALEQKISGLPVSKNIVTYTFGITVPGSGDKRRIHSSVFVERNNKGHPVRLVGISRRLD